jgi:hypothetical protein
MVLIPCHISRLHSGCILLTSYNEKFHYCVCDERGISETANSDNLTQLQSKQSVLILDPYTLISQNIV